TAGPAGAASFEVTTTADSGAGSLRQAIIDANGNGQADTITFAPGLGTIDLTSGELDITDDLTITDPEGDVSIDTGGSGRIVDVFDAGSVTISGLTLSGGSTGGSGGAILSRTTDLTVTDSTVTGNATGTDGG